MSTPHKCPVCNGTGRVHEVTKKETTNPEDWTKSCHACHGSGVVREDTWGVFKPPSISAVKKAKPWQ